MVCSMLSRPQQEPRRSLWSSWKQAGKYAQTGQGKAGGAGLWLGSGLQASLMLPPLLTLLFRGVRWGPLCQLLSADLIQLGMVVSFTQASGFQPWLPIKITGKSLKTVNDQCLDFTPIDLRLGEMFTLLPR